MVQKQYPKDKQGKAFRLEVASVDPPVVDPTPPINEEECTLSAAVLGHPVGTDVKFSIYEPHALHDQAVGEVSGTTQEKSRIVEAKWTFEWADHKDNISAARFVCVARVGDLVNISEPFEFKQKFSSTVKDEDGNPLPNRTVLLRPVRGPSLEVQSDAEGKIEELVPPGTYRVEVVV